MKFIVSSHTLLKQIQLVNGVVATNSTVPILDHILFQLKEKSLRLSASDLETTISTSFDVESSDEGSIAVPAKLLLEVLKSLPDQPITAQLSEDKSLLEIASEYGKYSIAVVDGDEYPRLPQIDDPSETVIPAEVLAVAIQKTLFATSNDDLRPTMAGVFFQLTSDSLTFVATDAHKLVRYRRTDYKSDNTAEFIMPKKPLNLLKNILASADSEVKITFNPRNARFEFDNTQLTCRLVDGKYPNYEAVIPKENPNNLRINRASFLSTVKRVSIFANKTTNQIRLKLAGTELAVSAEDIDFSTKAHERHTCDYSGDDMEIGFNARFLTEMLSNLESDAILMELSTPNRAGIIFPEDGLEEGEEVLMLVMPVMINS